MKNIQDGIEIPTVPEFDIEDEEIFSQTGAEIDEEELAPYLDDAASDLKFELVEQPEKEIAQNADGSYSYTFPDGTVLTMSVPAGAVTTSPVTVTPGDGQSVIKILRDDKAIYMFDDYIFSESGHYQVTVLTTSGKMETGNNMAAYRDTVSFQICSENTSEPEALTTPEGFTCVSVTCDGTKIPVISQSMSLEQDGRYEMIFECSKDSSIRYKTEYLLDRTIPELIFSKDIEGVVKPPLSMEPSEEGCTVTMMRGAENAELSSLVLNESGSYLLTVTDAAGNSRSYSVTMGLPGLRFHLYWVIIPVFLLAILGFYLKHIREHTQVL